MNKTSQKIFISLIAIFIATLGVTLYLKFKKINPPLPSNSPTATKLPELKEFRPKVILDTSKWRQYSNKEFGVYFKYPEELSLDQNISGESLQINLSSETPNNDPESQAFITLTAKKPIPDFLSQFKDEFNFQSKILINTQPYVVYISPPSAVSTTYRTIKQDKYLEISEELYSIGRPVRYVDIYENIVFALRLD